MKNASKNDESFADALDVEFATERSGLGASPMSCVVACRALSRVVRSRLSRVLACRVTASVRVFQTTARTLW